VIKETLLPYTPRAQQREIHSLLFKHRFGVVVCHRRMGKTVLSVNHLIRAALMCQLSRPRFGYLSPTYAQGKATAFDFIQHYSANVEGRAVNQSELRVDFPSETPPDTKQVRIYGADNPDSLRGLYFDGVVLDEFGLHQSKTYSEVVVPTLVDRGGWALFCGTPNGRNQFYEIAEHAKERVRANDPNWFFAEYKASQTGLLDLSYLAQAREVMTADEYAQEFECSFEAAVKGAIYAKEMEAARAAGRITRVPYDPALPVDTTWDLGIGDAMAVWFSQSTRGGEIRLVDYLESSGEGFPWYAARLSEKGYVYGKHWAPYDINVRELSSGRSRLEVAASQGIRFEVVPRLHDSVAGEVEEGIHAARMLFARCWFDATKCKEGLEALMHYRRDYNERLNEFKATPVHDWASHGADAFRYLACWHQVPVERKRRRLQNMPLEWSWT
jgi:phage terminase large subunit